MTRQRFLPLTGLLALGIAMAWTLAHRDSVDGVAVRAWLDGLGPWAAPAFVAAYAIGALVFFPGSILTLAGGAVFGPVAGTLLSLLGATLGATLAFLVARSTGGAWVADRLGGRLGELVRGVEDDGWRFVAFMRLVPLFPYNILNFALGLTRISLSHYVLASAVCMLPGAAAYSYLGYAGREALTGTGPAMQAGIIGLALLGTAMFVLPRVADRLRGVNTLEVAELRGMFEGGEPLTLIDVRGRDEFCGPLGHIPGAVCIPVDELHERVGEIAPSQRGPVVVVCKSDKRSSRAARLLRRSNVLGVQVLRGGVDAWRHDGQPVATCTTQEAS